MIEIIYDDRMSLRYSAVGHFIINKEAVIFPCHFFGFFLQSFEITAVVFVIDFIIKRHKVKMFLCWSHFAKQSKWVDTEWRYAFNQKGADGIEPIPLESPSVCPPPEELSKKHFNDKMLFIINGGNTEV